MDNSRTQEFQSVIRTYYAAHGRYDLPWRTPESDGQYDPYKIMVSELMLQQTQVARVIPKFLAFIKLFPTVKSLSAAQLGQVLTAWSGLGYNRRAKFLHQAAKLIQHEFGGEFPHSQAALVQLPGVGKNTAGAIMAYAFNQPVVFVETNIRTVYLYHFFQGQANVSDTEILKLVGETMDTQNPRTWFWSLMDYGTYVKQSSQKLNALSKHYSKQPSFVGSRRQLRGQIIKLLTKGPLSKTKLQQAINDTRLSGVLIDLVNESMIHYQRGKYSLD